MRSRQPGAAPTAAPGRRGFPALRGTRTRLLPAVPGAWLRPARGRDTHAGRSGSGVRLPGGPEPDVQTAHRRAPWGYRLLAISYSSTALAVEVEARSVLGTANSQ